MFNNPSLRSRIGPGLLLVFLTLAVYWPVTRFEFTNYDDPEYVINNSAIQSGITRTSIAWALTSGYASNWHPVTWISHMVDCRFFGLNPGGHHLTNLLFHVANVGLLFWFWLWLSGEVWPGFFVAALFAWHPLHVESVAWISERKDVLSTFFWLLVMLAYGKYVQLSRLQKSGARAFYFATLLFCALGLMSKPMVVTLPFALLLLDYWPLARIPRMDASGSKREVFVEIAPLILEKIPFVVLSALDCAATWWAQKETQAIVDSSVLPMSGRIANTIVSYVRYLGKTVWPSDLAVLYPYPDRWFFWQIAGATVVLLAISYAALKWGRERKYLLCGWLWFLGTLVPVIGVVQVGIQSMADRYTYIPSIGIFIMAAWGARDLVRKFPQLETSARAVAALVLGACLLSTWIQVHYWRDSITLFSHTIAVTSNNVRAECNLAEALARSGREKEAVDHYLRAVKMHPNRLEARYTYQPEANRNLALILAGHGQFAQAEPFLRQTIHDKPQFSAAHNDLGSVLLSLGRLDEAIREYRAALQTSYQNQTARLNLANALAENREFDQACVYYRAAARLDPNNPLLHDSYGVALAGAGRFGEATNEFHRSIELKPDRAETHLNFGCALINSESATLAAPELEMALRLQPDLPVALDGRARFFSGYNRLNAAESSLRSALNLRPNDAETHHQLAVVLSRQGRVAAAIPELRESLRLDPDALEAMNDLAWILATSPNASLRNGAEAVRLAEKLCEAANHGIARYSGTLDAAYAEAGLMDRAVTTARETAELARLQRLPDLADLAGKRLQLYLAGHPYHEAP